MKYIALLRGINVGGNRKVDMKRLKALLECSAYWGYYKYSIFDDSEFDGSEGDPPQLPPITIRTDTREKWMEVECNPGNMDQETEWDWMTFFWELHSDNGDTGSTRRWSVSEVLSAWPDDSSDSEVARGWDLIYSALAPGAQRNFFNSLSSDTGVKHYTP